MSISPKRARRSKLPCRLGELSQVRITAVPSHAAPRQPAVGRRSLLAVVAGPGLAEAVSSLGGVPVLATDGDVTIEQLAAAAQQTCGDVVILPNGSQNLKRASEVATELRRSGRRVGIIPTHAQVQGLAAMAVHEPSADFESAVVAMSSAAGHARHAAISVAQSAAMTSAGRCEPGAVLGIIEGDVVLIGTSLAEVAWQLVQRLLNAGGELLTLVRGTGAGDDLLTEITARVRATIPDGRCRGVGGRAVALSAVARAGMTTLRLVGSPWRTDTFRRLANRLENIVGSKTAKQFEPLKILSVDDLMRHLPRRYFSGTELSDLSALREGEEVAVMAEVVDARTFNLPDRPNYRLASKPRLEATITDHGGRLTCTFFGQPRLISYWQKQLVPGARGIFAGKVTRFNGRLQLAHPDFVIVDEHGTVIGGAKHNASLASASGVPLVGIYPTAGKLRTWTIADCASLALASLEGIEDPLPSWVRDSAGVVELEAAFRAVHQPTEKTVIAQGRHRMRFDEAFALQLTMAYRRADAASHRAVPRQARSGGLLEEFDDRLPFVLTKGQIAVSEEIMAELGRSRPMQRLLQGEVGSGKTLVALRAMLAVVDAGGQAALLAPTEVLAAQHYQTITRMLGDLAGGGTLDAPEHATGVVLITGSTSAARRREATLACCVWDSRDSHRYPRLAQRGCSVCRSRPGRRRRAASVRGRATRGAERQSRSAAARPGHDSNADSAFGGHDRLR